MPSKFIVGLALLVWWHWPQAARRRYRRAIRAALSAQGWVPARALSLAAAWAIPQLAALIGAVPIPVCSVQSQLPAPVVSFAAPSVDLRRENQRLREGAY
jgi:hypothetical protein